MLLLAGVAYLGAEGWRGAQECLALQRAERIGQPPRHYSYARIAALAAAFKVEPKNFDTAQTIAECYRLKTLDGGDDYAALARKAMEWYQRGMTLNPYDANNWLYYGMCLDLIGTEPGGSKEAASTYYNRANELDPNGYFTTAYTGWHYLQTGDLAAARTWFERSQQLEPSKTDNKMTYEYLAILENRLEDAAKPPKQP